MNVFVGKFRKAGSRVGELGFTKKKRKRRGRMRSD